MIYPQMTGKGLKWVGSTLKFFEKYYKKSQIVPIIQVSKMPENSPDKFECEDAKRLAEYVNKKTNGNFGYFALDLMRNNNH